MRASFGVIVPCYNEKENIEECAQRLLQLDELDVITLVDDGSTDGSAEVCAKLAGRFRPRLQALLLPTNRGKNHAIHDAAQQTATDVIVILDGDLTIEPEHLRSVVQSYRASLNRFVYGSRFLLQMEAGAMPLLNRLGNRIFSIWVSWLLGKRVSDVLCGLKSMPRQALLEIPVSSCRWGDFDLMFGAARQNLEFQELPLRYRRRKKGDSKMKLIQSGWVFFVLCCRLTYDVFALKLHKLHGSLLLNRA